MFRPVCRLEGIKYRLLDSIYIYVYLVDYKLASMTVAAPGFQQSGGQEGGNDLITGGAKLDFFFLWTVSM